MAKTWRLVAFNVFNHTNFVDLDTNFESANFGRLTSTAGAREVQLGARIVLKEHKLNRRYFIRGSAAAAAASWRSVAASDKVTVALMGLRGRGQTMAKWFAALPDVRIPYVCDVDRNVVVRPLRS